MRKKQKEAVTPRAQEENQTEISRGSKNESWSSNSQNIKETDPQGDMEVKSSTKLIAYYQ